MEKRLEKFLLSPVYPILLSIYPILTLFSANTYQSSFSVLYRPFLLSLLAGILLLGIMKGLFREWHKSALFATLGIFFLGFYGHIRNFLVGKNVQGASIYILSGGLFFLLLFLFMDKKYAVKLDYPSLAPSMNLIAIILLLFPVIKITRYYVAKQIAFSSIENTYAGLDRTHLETFPDIYYIIPDAYGRSDVLAEIYEYDNSEFIEKLEDLDFYVAKCAQSNYPITLLSLTSSLNVDYIPNLNEHFTPEEDDILYLFATLRKNSVAGTFKASGYKTVAFASGFPWAEMQNADIFLSPPSNAINEFEVLFLQTTFAQFLDDINLVDYNNISAERYRERTRFVFENLSEIAKMPESTFVFVHLLLPHPPFGLDAEGNSINPAEVSFIEGYTNQAAYFDDEIIKQIEVILAESETPPIIILQGDHGPPTSRPEQHLSILNAYYLPEHANSLYPTITPVNTFRLILSEYFGENYPLLEDASYSLENNNNYDFTYTENPCEE